MAAGDYLFQVLPILVLILERPTAAPGDPDPVELRLLEQAEHLLEIAVIDVGQHVLLFGAELFAPPSPLGLPALDLSAVDPNETKIPLLCPGRHVLRLGAIQFRSRLKGLGGEDQQECGGETNPTSPTLFTIRTRRMVLLPRNALNDHRWALFPIGEITVHCISSTRLTQDWPRSLLHHPGSAQRQSPD